jgi:hypothetical protein
VFAGGSGGVWADESTHRGDILFFTGLSGVASARITFAIRDRLSFFRGNGHAYGRKGFLLRISGLDAVSAPEPGSMLLLGAGLAGLAGLAAARRRRRAASH